MNNAMLAITTPEALGFGFVLFALLGLVIFIEIKMHLHHSTPAQEIQNQLGKAENVVVPVVKSDLDALHAKLDTLVERVTGGTPPQPPPAAS